MTICWISARSSVAAAATARDWFQLQPLRRQLNPKVLLICASADPYKHRLATLDVIMSRRAYHHRRDTSWHHRLQDQANIIQVRVNTSTMTGMSSNKCLVAVSSVLATHVIRLEPAEPGPTIETVGENSPIQRKKMASRCGEQREIVAMPKDVLSDLRND